MKFSGRRFRISLVQRLGLILLALVMLIITSAGGSLWFSSTAGEDIEYMRQAADHSAKISELQRTWLSVVGTLDTFSVTRPAPGAKADLDHKLAELNTKLAELSATGSLGMSPVLIQDNQQIIGSMRQTFDRMEGLSGEINALSDQGRWGTALQRRQSGLSELQGTLEEDLRQLNLNLQTDLEARSEQVHSSQRVSRLLALVSVLLSVVFAGGVAWMGQRMITRPMRALAAQMQRITQGDFSPVVPLDRNDEIGDLSRSVAKMTEWLGQSYETLEKRVQERTQALQKRTAQVQLSAQVSRDIASARSLEQLLENAVELVRERYGFYHAGIFLTDARGEYQVLRSATGEAGRLMLEKQHSLRIGQTGLVGHAAFSGQARVSTDVGQDVVHYKNPLLPETRSEAALPLVAGGHVIGVLDVQSQEPDAFDPESLSILQVMADQLAIAIQNARLVDEIQKNLADVQNAYGQLERQAWAQFFESNPNLGYSYDGVEVRALQAEAPEIEDPAHAGDPFHLPLRVRGEEIGALEVWPREDRFTEAEEYMLATLSSRLSQILESARLYEETQARASREEIINRLTATVARSLDLDGVLRSAALELGRLPGVREAAVVLDTASGKPKDTGPLNAHPLPADAGRNGNTDGGGNGHRA